MKPRRRPSTGRLRNLTRLLATLREHGVTEYEMGPLKLRLAPATRRAEANLGKPPGLVTSETSEARRMLAQVGLDEGQAADLAASLGMES
jgi:hypothetical protein